MYVTLVRSGYAIFGANEWDIDARSIALSARVQVDVIIIYTSVFASEE